jgi:hypothetical protein
VPSPGTNVIARRRPPMMAATATATPCLAHWAVPTSGIGSSVVGVWLVAFHGQISRILRIFGLQALTWCHQIDYQ